jgi:hypothetical protein
MNGIDYLFAAMLGGRTLAAPLGLPPVDDAPVSAGLSCPADMRLVVGTHHEIVERLCLRFEHDQCWDWLPGLTAYEGRETPVATCMDVYEWPNQKGAVPPVMMRFVEAQKSCESVGKRLCSENEWELACEGPETLPYPYGWKQKTGACVNEKPYRPYSQAKLSSDSTKVREEETRRLFQAEPSGSRSECTSPFGVVDLVGNVEEWVTTSRPEWAYPSSLKGGYWSKPWTGCRGTNDSHGPMFRFYDIGFRCCSDPTRVSPPAAAAKSPAQSVL